MKLLRLTIESCRSILREKSAVAKLRNQFWFERFNLKTVCSNLNPGGEVRMTGEGRRTCRIMVNAVNCAECCGPYKPQCPTVSAEVLLVECCYLSQPGPAAVVQGCDIELQRAGRSALQAPEERSSHSVT